MSLDLDAVRARLATSRGPEYWRSLEELADDPHFREMVHREFPRQASEWVEPEGDDGVSRRNFLQLASASLALAGLTACTKQPLERIVPYVKQPEELVPGKPLYYATAVTAPDGYAAPVLVETHMGRPTKVEGNPEHPWSLGASDVFTQAAILSLYDPDRAQTITDLGAIRTWKAFVEAMAPVMAAQAAIGGEGLRLLTPAITSPTLLAQIRALLAAHPKAVWHQWEPAGRDAVRAGAQLAFGAYVETRYDLEKADVIVALDSDFLTQGPGAVRYARQFADRRRLRGAGDAGRAMNRFYAVESTPSATGTNADHRWALEPAELATFARALAHALGVAGVAAPSGSQAAGGPMVEAVARDLRAHAGRSLVVVGETCDPALHALGHSINAALGNVGATVLHTEPVDAAPLDHLASLQALASALAAGTVDLLVIIGTNPVYDAPADLDFSAALRKAPLRVHVGLYADETSRYCQWQIPLAHDFEAWGDVRALDGTATIQQPLIEPLYGSKSALEVVAALAGAGQAKGMDLVRQSWQERGLDDRAWRQALHDGMVAGSAAPVLARAPNPPDDARLQVLARANSIEATAVPVLFKPDPTIHDGRFANSAWLQECPKPLTKLTWDNALLVAPRTARRLGLRHEELAAVAAGERRVDVPVWVMPGHAENCATLHLGFGRTAAGRVGDGVGTNVYPLRTAAAPWLVRAEVSGGGESYPFSSTQMHSNIELEGEEAQKRHLVRTATLAEYVRDPGLIHEMGEAPDRGMTLYPNVEYKGYAWGMAIDLNACTGCNACVVACQAENNIPTVGKEQVRRGREMHWIRVDRYYTGELDDPMALHQPIVCMHCENAPCETVCPVAATVHSSEGLNDMVYNRCVGTRYCSNNCPYKVRRFNFLFHNGNAYNDARSNPVLELLRNPDVTVRSRGVMEKCTYCVQRINRAKIESEIADRKVRDGEIQTACQQACPSRAITFGDVNDPVAEVSVWKSEPRNYGLIEELNTRPRTSYLARIRNPNPELEAIG